MTLQFFTLKNIILNKYTRLFVCVIASISLSFSLFNSSVDTYSALVCPDDSYTLNGTVCERTITQDATCPAGYVIDGNQCIQVVSKTCPDNYILQSDGWCTPNYRASRGYKNCRINNRNGVDSVFPVWQGVECNSITSQIGETAFEGDFGDRSVDFFQTYTGEGRGNLDISNMANLIIQIDNSGTAGDLPVINTNFEGQSHLTFDVCENSNNGNVRVYVKANDGSQGYNCAQNIGEEWRTLWWSSREIRNSGGGSLFGECPVGSTDFGTTACQITANPQCPAGFSRNLLICTQQVTVDAIDDGTGDDGTGDSPANDIDDNNDTDTQDTDIPTNDTPDVEDDIDSANPDNSVDVGVVEPDPSVEQNQSFDMDDINQTSSSNADVDGMQTLPRTGGLQMINFLYFVIFGLISILCIQQSLFAK